MMRVRSLEGNGIVEPPIYNIKNDRTTLGRGRSNDICIGEETVSRHHATIIRDRNHRYILEGVGKNGILVNGRTDTILSLSNGDVFTLSKISFIFEKNPDIDQKDVRQPPTPAPPSLLKKRGREDYENDPPPKKIRQNSGKETPKPKTPGNRTKLSKDMNPNDINHLIEVLNTTYQKIPANWNGILFVIEITEFLTSMEDPTFGRITSNTRIKQALSKAATENNACGLAYFASVVFAKVIELDKKRFQKKVNFDVVSFFFDFPQCYIALPCILFAVSKHESRKQSAIKLLREKLLLQSEHQDVTLHSMQGDLVTNCLLDCKRHKSGVIKATDYFTDEIIFTRILHFALDAKLFESGSPQMITKLQMLDAIRYILQILKLHPTYHPALTILQILHDWVPDMRCLIAQAQTGGSLTSCLKSLQLFELLLELYWKTKFSPINFHNEVKFIREMLFMINHPRQHVFLPQAITILKTVFSEDTPKSFFNECLDEILKRKIEWIKYYQKEEIQYFFKELYGILRVSNAISAEQRATIQFLDLDNINFSSLTCETYAENPEPNSYCILI